MCRLFLVPALLLVLGTVSSTAEAAPARGLDIRFIDTEGGAATLIVTPAGESVLIDCGNPGSRDAERIHKAATAAGLQAIDHLLITHWHSDHYGGALRLSKLMPVRNFYDRGIPDQLDEDPKNFPLLIQAYKEASRGKSRALKPGDVVPLKQQDGSPAVRLFCLCSCSEVIPDSPRQKDNPIAKDHKPQPVDKTDNANSLGFVLSYGSFRFLDLGDLTWNIEYKLIHPTDKIGPIDVYQVTHHGLEISNNPVLIRTVRPRVAIFNNGARKGCHPSVTAALRRVEGLKAIYQVHRNLMVGGQENTDPDFIANPDEKCRGESITLAVAPDAKSYTVTVGSKGRLRRYETRPEEK
jgi:beta-lactamase superfamily II metal-dependent hydrolase